MSQNQPKSKISKILSANVKSDPVKSGIIRKEKEPNRDILTDWVPFFKDTNNVYINDLAKRTRRSSTHSAILNTKTTFSCGSKFEFVNENGDVLDYDDLPLGFRDWVMNCNQEGQSLRDVFCSMVSNYIKLGNSYLNVVKGGDKPLNLYSWDSTKFRIKKDKSLYYVTSYWRDIGDSSTIQDKYKAITLDAEGHNKNDFVICVKNLMPEFDYYGLPDWVGAIDWVDIEYRISKFNIDKFDNGLMPSAMLSIYGQAPEGMTPKAYTQAIANKFTGEGNNDKMLVQLLDSPESKPDVFEFTRERDGEFRELSELATNNIVRVHRFSPALAGLETSGKLGSTQQLRLEYEKFMNSVAIPDYQKPILNAFNKVIREYMGLPYKLKVVNLPPIGLAGMIDPVKVMTLNEQREQLGLEMDEDGDRYLNIGNNSNNNTDGV